MQAFDTFHQSTMQELRVLRDLLAEAIQKVAPVKQVVIRTDIAALSCKALRTRIIRERGPQAAAVLATKLNAGLAKLGKARAQLSRPARNGNGTGVHDHAD
jgi:hypothetical protein